MVSRDSDTPRHLYNLAVERAVIGLLVTDPDRLMEVSGDLRSDHFYDRIHQRIYTGILTMAEEGIPIDFVSVLDSLRGQSIMPNLESYIAECTQLIVTTSGLKSKADILISYATKRDYRDFAHKLLADTNDPEMTADQLRDMSEKAIVALSTSASQVVPLRTITSDWFDRYVRVAQGDDTYHVDCGYPLLKKYLPLAPGHMVVLAGRASMGKTALALDIALNVAKQGRGVGFFSYEMTNHEMMERLVSKQLGVSTQVLQQGQLPEDQQQQLGSALDELNQLPLYLHNDPDRSLNSFKSKARRLKLEHDVALIVVDYLQLLFTTDALAQQSRVQMVSFVSNSIKALALELEVPIVALSQLSRKVEDRPNKIPQLSDLRDSGEIEQDADQVCMVYREGYYHDDVENPNRTDIYIRKNRHGPTGSLQLHFDSHNMTFRSVDQCRSMPNAS